MSDSVFLYMIGIVGSVLGWGVWVEIRIRQHERDIQSMQDTAATALTDIKAELSYIRARLDKLVDQR